MTVTVQSNNNYVLSVSGADDLVGINTANIMTIEHFKIQLEGDSLFKDISKTSTILADNEVNTNSKIYNINIKLVTDWGIKPDIYKATIIYKVKQCSTP